MQSEFVLFDFRDIYSHLVTQKEQLLVNGKKISLPLRGLPVCVLEEKLYYAPRPGASCSKLHVMMSLVNDLLKFQMAILRIHCYFLLKNVRILCIAKRILCIAKDSHIFSTNNNSVFAFEVDIQLTK